MELEEERLTEKERPGPNSRAPYAGPPCFIATWTRTQPFCLFPILFAVPLTSRKYLVSEATLTYAKYNRSPNNPSNTAHQGFEHLSHVSLERKYHPKEAETHLTAHSPVSPTRTSTRPKNRMRDTQVNPLGSLHLRARFSRTDGEEGG